MDGVNPTLAFAVLLFGFSGNTHDPPTNAEIESEAGCPTLMIARDAPQPSIQETWTEAFQNSLESAPAAAVDEQLAGSVFRQIEGPQPNSDLAPVAAADGSDPIMRRIFPVGTNLLAVESETDPCEPER
ncbi:MAG TPA: hypothetical protein VFE34_20990 [Dongiaceae bacterium]|jgi:hypothetical protein|nr:hypothetical protein [Dongiaceae bacterium]